MTQGGGGVYGRIGENFIFFVSIGRQNFVEIPKEEVGLGSSSIASEWAAFLNVVKKRQSSQSN